MTEINQQRVAVIIPTYNDGARLTKCLEALSLQTYPMSEVTVYVVDNNSSQDIKSLVEPFAFVEYVFEAKPGAYSARNKALEALKDEAFVGFTDADCIPEPTWIENAVKALSGKTMAAVGGDVEVFIESEGKPSAAALYEKLFAFPQQVYVEKNHFAVTANLFLTKAALLKVGKFDDTLFSGGDAAYGNAMRESSVMLTFDSSVLVKHPARDTVAKLTNKVKRTVGGCYSQRANNPFMKASFSFPALIRGFMPPAKALKELFTYKEALSFSDKVKVAWLLFYLKYHKNVIKLGYKLGLIRDFERF